ncbi:hypothetical protein [Algoriphagus boritolerans]|uniref:hypothetical protein n=1 Tax=Algoriphagus boritolerans TaxID=308111 RepID=UPI002FCE0837
MCFFRDRESLKNTDYWITYSFVDSKRSYFQYTGQVQPDFAPKHNLSVVVKHFVPNLKSQLGLSWSFNDGLSYTDPNQPGEMNSKTSSFQNLSLSWSYLPRPNLIIHGAITNVTGHQNIFGYQFAQAPNEQEDLNPYHSDRELHDSYSSEFSSRFLKTKTQII